MSFQRIDYPSVKKGYDKRKKSLKTDLKLYLRNKTSGLSKKCEVKNMLFDLNKEFLYDLYLKQNGNCYYTGIKIKHNKGCHQYDSISVERLNPDKGYTKDNTVLAAFAINSFKGMMSEKEFKKFLETILPKLNEYKNKS